MKELNEMEKLICLLTYEKIPFQVTTSWGNTLQVWYPNKAESICDAICHEHSYGHEEGFLEIMGLVNEEEVGDTVEGWLTATDVFSRIKKDWKERKRHDCYDNLPYLQKK